MENLDKANNAYTKAKKLMGKTLFRWKPDYEQASRFLRDAIKYYRLAGPNYSDTLLLVLIDSSKCHEEISSYHTAGEHAENAAKIYIEKKDYFDAAKCYQNAARLYGLNSSINKCSINYLKAAEIVASKIAFEPAYKLINYACSNYIDNIENCELFHESTFTKAISICISNNKFDYTLELLQELVQLQIGLKKEFEQDIYKNQLCIIIVLLYTDKLDIAIIEHSKHSKVLSYTSSNEYIATSVLLGAFLDGNPEQLDECLKTQPAFKYIHIAIARLARNLRMTNKHILDGKQRQLVLDQNSDDCLDEQVSLL